MCGGGGDPQPTIQPIKAQTPVEIPRVQDQSANRSRKDETRNRRRAIGQRSNIKTSPFGVTESGNTTGGKRALGE